MIYRIDDLFVLRHVKPLIVQGNAPGASGAFALWKEKSIRGRVMNR